MAHITIQSSSPCRRERRCHRNPEVFEGECGLTPGASAQIGAMLVGRDVSLNGDRRPHDRVLSPKHPDGPTDFGADWVTESAGV